MAGHKSHGTGNEALKDLKWIIALFIALWVLWLYTGGPARMTKNNPFIKPAAPLDTGKTYGPHNTFVNPTQ